VIAFSSFDRRSSHSPGRLNRLQEVGRAPIGAPASTNAGTKTSRFGRGGCGIVASAPTPVHPGSHAQLPETISIVCGRSGGHRSSAGRPALRIGSGHWCSTALVTDALAPTMGDETA
jgi:hypothetical protein